MESESLNQGVATEDIAEPNSQSAGTGAGRNMDSAGDSLADRDRLTKEKNELQDLLQRRQAEFDNFRRRNERERGELIEYASMDTVKALLPVLDDFERALKAESADKEYARGMEMIHTRLSEALRKQGLEAVTSDAVFDPHVHHAVEMVDTQEHPDQTILEEYQRGYRYKGRLLRPAMVKVAVNH